MLHDLIRSKIVRQELDIVEAGPHFKLYSAKVKYLPENIEKADFFSLCYGMLKTGDRITVYTYKKDDFEVYYDFLVAQVNGEEKKVDVILLKKIDLRNPGKAASKSKDKAPAGIDPEVIEQMVQEKVSEALKEILEWKTSVNDFVQTMTDYTKDTDDQLEEIENNIETITKSLTKPKTEKATKE